MTVWWNNGCVQIEVGRQGKQLGARKWVRIQLSSSAPVTGRLTVGDETILGVEPHPLFAAISIVWARRDPRQRRIVNQREVGKSVALCVCSLSVVVFVSMCVCVCVWGNPSCLCKWASFTSRVSVNLYHLTLSSCFLRRVAETHTRLIGQIKDRLENSSYLSSSWEVHLCNCMFDTVVCWGNISKPLSF